MTTRERIVSMLLACGVLSAFVYAATDILAALQWEGYRITNQAVSELLAVGSPTRSFIVPGMALYNTLMLAFGVGVWMAADDRRSLKATGALMMAYSVVSWLGLVVFPLRPDSGLAGSGAMPLSGVLHGAATAVLVLLMFAFIITGSGAGGRPFRVYSIATIVLVLGGGIWAGTFVERVAAGEHPVGFGLIERANIYSTLVWVAVLAIVLLRAQRAAAQAPASSGPPPRMKRVVARQS